MYIGVDRFWDILLMVAVTWGFTLIMPKYSPLFIGVITGVLIRKFIVLHFEKRKNSKKKKKRGNMLMEEEE